MTTSILRRATALANPTSSQARTAAEILADLGLHDRPAFAGGGPVPGVAPSSITPTWGDRPKFRDMAGRYDWERPDADPALLAALAVARGQRPAFANGGAVDHALSIAHGKPDPLKGRPHFEAGGDASRGYGGSSGGDENNGGVGNGGWSSGYGGFGLGGVGSQSSSSASNGGNPSHGTTSSQSSSGGGFNSGAAAGSSTGGYGGFGGYSSSASVGGSYGGASAGGSYSSSAVSSGGSSSANGGYGSVAGSLGQSGSTGSYGGGMSSNGGGAGSYSSHGSTQTGGFGGLSSTAPGSYSSAASQSGFGNFNSTNTGAGVGNTSASSNNNGFGSLGAFSSQATEPGNAALASALSSAVAQGQYSGYRGGQDSYGTNVAVAAANAPNAEQTAVAGPIAASGGFGDLTNNNPGFTSVGSQYGVADASKKTATEGFGSFGDENTPSIGMMDSSLSKLGYGSFTTPAGVAYAGANSLAGQGVAPGIANTGGMDSNATGMTPAASAAFSAGVNAGAAMESGMAGSGLTAANDTAQTHIGALSPSIRAAMASQVGSPMGTTEASSIAPGDVATNKYGMTDAAYRGLTAGIGAAPAGAASTSTDPVGALTVHGPYSGVTTANTLGPGTNVVGDFGGIQGISEPGVPGSLTAAQQAQMDAYSKQHEALVAPTQKAMDALNGTFGPQAASVFGVSQDAMRSFMNAPTENVATGQTMLGALDHLKAEAVNGDLSGIGAMTHPIDAGAVSAMMKEGAFTDPGAAVDAVKGFVSNKMADVAPHFSVTSTPGYSIGSMPSMGTSVASANDSFGITGGLSPSIAAAAGLTATNDPSSVDGIHALTMHGPMSAGAQDAMSGNYDAPAGLDTPAGVDAYSIADIAKNFGAYGYAAKYGLPSDYSFSNPQRLAAVVYGNMANEAGVNPATQTANWQHYNGTPDPGLIGHLDAGMIAGGNDFGLSQWTGARRDQAINAIVSGAAAAGDTVDPSSINPTKSMSVEDKAAMKDAVRGIYGTFNSQIANTLGELAANKTYAPSLAAVNMPGMDNIPGAVAVYGGNFEAPANLSASISRRVASAQEAARALGQIGQPNAAAPSGTTSPAIASAAPMAKGDLSTGQKVTKYGANIALGMVPGVGPALAGANLISGLLGYGTVGDALAKSSPAQPGSPAMAGADHTSTGGFTGGTAPYYDPNGSGYHGGGEGGYGSLPSATGSAANYGVQRVDPNAAAATALAAIGGAATATPSATGTYAALASVSPPDVNVGAPGAYFYDPMADPVVVNALKLARGEKLAA